MALEEQTQVDDMVDADSHAVRPGSLRSPSQQFCGRNVLITGGLGFVGSNLATELLNRGAHVTVLDKRAHV